MVMHRKGWVRTMEAVLAFFVTLIFTVFIISTQSVLSQPKEPLKVLATLETDEGFRNCIYAGNSSCAVNLASQHTPPGFEVAVTINELAPFNNDKDIYAESLFFVGNVTDDYKIVKLYYWQR